MSEDYTLGGVTIRKGDITPLGALKGKTNAKRLMIGSFVVEPLTVVFRGFAGARLPDGSYGGAVRFTRIEDPSEYDTFDVLPGVTIAITDANTPLDIPDDVEPEADDCNEDEGDL